MRRAATIGLSVVLAVGGFAAGRLVPAPSSPAQPASRKVVRYQCPMHPRSPRGPGTGPCCGMALEPVYEGGNPAATGAPPRPAGSVAIEAGLRQLQGVKVSTVEKGATTQAFRLFRQVAPDETLVYSITRRRGSASGRSPV